MVGQRHFLLFAVLATAAMAQSALVAGESEKNGSAPIPNLTGIWTHPAFPWFEPPATGPGPITNLSRWPVQRPAGDGGSVALPPAKVGISDYDQLVGDYNNPILQPWAAAVVKQLGEMSLAGVTFPNPSNQCWPEPPPFIYKKSNVLLVQWSDRVMLLYAGDGNQIRWVRLNAQHPVPLKPSWNGDSIGHYEGDTLVVDTIGVNPDRKYAMIDLFGTPYTDKLHIVERYRLRDYDEVKDALERNRKENWLFAGDVWTRHRNDKFLQAHVTVDDAGVFTSPWTATLTYAPGNPISETTCAENPNEYYNNRESDVPKAARPDF